MKSHDSFLSVVYYGSLGAFAGLLAGLVFGLIIYVVLSLTLPVSVMGGDMMPIPMILMLGMGWGTLIGGIFGGVVGLQKK